MLFPGCDRCGQCGCACGTLPYTMTVEFSGLQNKTHSQHCALTFASDFGGGASAVAMLPGGCDDDDPACGAPNRGPLTEVLLLDGGSCYARVGRREPTLTITATPGEDATFTATLVPINEKLAVQCRSYKVDSISVSGGTGYVGGTTLKIKSDGTVVTPAVAKLVTGRAEPTLTATVDGGSGAELTVTLASNGNDPETWGVDSVSVTSGGSGYTDGDPVTFTVEDGGHVVVAATATITVGTSPPECTNTSCGEFFYSADGGGSGSGAAASWSWAAAGERWALTGFTLTNAGGGYAVGDHLVWTVSADPENGVYEIVVTSVGAGGEITGWEESSDLYTPADFVGASGVGPILSVSVTAAGEYWRDTGVPSGVTVTTTGEYYTENVTIPPCVADVIVTACGGGEDASITPTIGVDPDDQATFGKITALTIDDGGTGYLAWRWICTPQAALNGLPLVLTAEDPKKLCTIDVQACFGSGACIRIVPKGAEINCESEPTTRTAAYDGGPAPIRQIEIEPNAYTINQIYDPTTGYGYAKLGREMPAWTLTQSGWTFTPVFGDEATGLCYLPVWPVDSFAITGSGIPIADGTALVIPAPSGDEKVEVGATAVVNSDEQGTPQSVTVTSAGAYYRENPALPPYVADITVNVLQLPPSDGSGCEIAVEVEDNPLATGFGGIKSATIVSEGSGYTLLGGPAECLWSLSPCGLFASPWIEFRLRGNGREPELTLYDNRTSPGNKTVLRCEYVMTGDCDALPESATLLYGAEDGVTATVTRGGVVDTSCDPPAWCSGCECPDFDDYCSSIEWTDLPPAPPGGGGNRSGTLQDVGDSFEEDGIVFGITCDPVTKCVTLGASAGRVCEGGETVLVFTKAIQNLDDCCDVAAMLVGEHTLTPEVPCDPCPCGSITWTISEAPC